MGVQSEKNEAVATARRHSEATQWQAETRDERSGAEGLNRRREFMLASGRVFFESVIGQLNHKAFILDQSEELENAGPLELDIETPKDVKETTIKEIQRLTALEFSGF